MFNNPTARIAESAAMSTSARVYSNNLFAPLVTQFAAIQREVR